MPGRQVSHYVNRHHSSRFASNPCASSRFASSTCDNNRSGNSSRYGNNNLHRHSRFESQNDGQHQSLQQQLIFNAAYPSREVYGVAVGDVAL